MRIIADRPNATIEIETKPCMVCGQKSKLTVDEAGYLAWRAGALIQRAFPGMPKDQREQLMTGTHGECWDKMFSDPEDEA